MRILHRAHVRLTVLLLLVLSAAYFYYHHAKKCKELQITTTTKHFITTKPTTTTRLTTTTTLKSVTKSLLQLAVLAGLSDYILMFNRIPKSGSEIFVLLLQKLQGVHFKHIRLGNGRLRRLNTTLQRNFARNINEIMKENAVPLSFDRIMYFTNFTQYGIQSPTFFSMIRDPFEAVIARMKYPPFGETIGKKINERDTQNFAQCWVNGDSGCSLVDGVPYDFTIPYFCGHEFQCMKLNNEYALKKAKSVVDRYYPVVGLLEYVNETIFVIENKLPMFFRRATHIFMNKIAGVHRKWTPKIDLSAIPARRLIKLKSVLWAEYEFYHWIKARLFRQVEELNVKNEEYDASDADRDNYEIE